MESNALIDRLLKLRKQDDEIHAQIRSVVLQLAGDTFTPPQAKEPYSRPVNPGNGPILDGLRIGHATLEYLIWAKAVNRAVTLRDLHTALTSQRVLSAKGKDICMLRPRKGTKPRLDAAWKAICAALSSPKYAKRLRITAPSGISGRAKFQPNFKIELADRK